MNRDSITQMMNKQFFSFSFNRPGLSNLRSKLLYKMGQDFMDIQYLSPDNVTRNSSQELAGCMGLKHTYWVTKKLPQICTANHATFPIQIRIITVRICGNFWVNQ